MKALATKILFEGSRAVGVEYVQNGKTLAARAGREVILCGGSINTPQLLQLSGIGPAALARRSRHPGRPGQRRGRRQPAGPSGLNYTWKARVPTLNQVLRPWWGKLAVGMRYLLLRDGPLSMSMNQGGGFFRTDPSETRPNMQLYFQAFSTVIPKSGERPILTPDPWPGFSIGLSNCRPTSRGSVTIRSSDPSVPPKIVANAYSTNHDVAEMLDAVKFLRRIAAQPSMARDDRRRDAAGTGLPKRRRADRRFPQAQRHGLSSGRDLPHGAGPGERRWSIRASACTASADLRVIDASVFPLNISGNTNAAAIVTGAKGADMVLEDQR